MHANMAPVMGSKMTPGSFVSLFRSRAAETSDLHEQQRRLCFTYATIWMEHLQPWPCPTESLSELVERPTPGWMDGEQKPALFPRQGDLYRRREVCMCVSASGEIQFEIPSFWCKIKTQRVVWRMQDVSKRITYDTDGGPERPEERSSSKQLLTYPPFTTMCARGVPMWLTI